jgi:hypothetical protein
MQSATRQVFTPYGSKQFSLPRLQYAPDCRVIECALGWPCPPPERVAWKGVSQNMSWLATNREGESKASNESTTDGISLPVGSTSSPTKNLPRARSSNLLSPYRWELPRVPRFRYMLTAGCCAQKRGEKTTPPAQAWLPLSKGLSTCVPNLPYRESPGSKPRAVSVCQNDSLIAQRKMRMRFSRMRS